MTLSYHLLSMILHFLMHLNPLTLLNLSQRGCAENIYIVVFYSENFVDI